MILLQIDTVIVGMNSQYLTLKVPALNGSNHSQISLNAVSS